MDAQDEYGDGGSFRSNHAESTPGEQKHIDGYSTEIFFFLEKCASASLQGY